MQYNVFYGGYDTIFGHYWLYHPINVAFYYQEFTVILKAGCLFLSLFPSLSFQLVHCQFWHTMQMKRQVSLSFMVIKVELPAHQRADVIFYDRPPISWVIRQFGYPLF